MRFAASAEGVNGLLDFLLCREGTKECTSDVAVQNLASLPKVTIVASLSQKVEPCTEAADAQRRPCVCQLGCEGADLWQGTANKAAGGNNFLNCCRRLIFC